MRFSVNIGLIYAELPYADRVGAVHDAGFSAVESFWPDADHRKDFVRAVNEYNVAVALINVNEGDYRAGDRGFAAHPRYREWWRSNVREAVSLAGDVGCANLNVLTGYFDPVLPEDEQQECLVENLRWAVPLAAKQGVTLLLEPLNEKTHAGYVCTNVRGAIELIDQVGAENVGIQFDFFQMGGAEGSDLALDILAESAEYVRHIQVADPPDRGAPGTGHLDYAKIFAVLKETYVGYVGLEYFPDPQDPFGWLSKYDI